MGKYIKAKVQGLSDKARRIFVVEYEGEKPTAKDLWVEVYKIKDVMGKVFWTTDISREEQVLMSGWVRYALTEKGEFE